MTTGVEMQSQHFGQRLSRNDEACSSGTIEVRCWEVHQLQRGRVMAVDVTTETIIDKTVDVVATFACDPSNAPTWYENIKSIEWKTEPPLQVGSKVAFVAYFLGRRLSYTYEIVDLVPAARLVMRTAQGPFPMETTYTFTAIDNGTRMSLRNRDEPAGFSRLVAPMIATAMKRANRKDLARLRDLLEAM